MSAAAPITTDAAASAPSSSAQAASAAQPSASAGQAAQAASSVERCGRSSCENEAKQSCPSCIELQIKPVARFCSQDCFKQAWKEHNNNVHKRTTHTHTLRTAQKQKCALRKCERRAVQRGGTMMLFASSINAVCFFRSPTYHARLFVSAHFVLFFQLSRSDWLSARLRLNTPALFVLRG